jgi:CRISPR system Cascade subunit CasE
MSAPLYMLKLQPRMPKLAAWAWERRLAGRDGDLGYALHAALAAAFGEHAPKPFRLWEPRPSARGDQPGGPALYGYVATAEPKLREHSDLAEPDVHAALGLETLALKPMPTLWANGRVLDFEVRIRPVVRCDRAGDRTRVRERDAFLAALPTGASPAIEDRIHREEVYREWLARELGRDGAAAPVPGTVRMTGFQRTRVLRRSHPAEDGRRALDAREGPDALFAGTLRIDDGTAFAALVQRGIGRHRAFGFGMLLLRPAGRRSPC